MGGTDSWVTDGWIKSPQSETDWGIVKLSEPIGNQTGWFQLGVFTTAGLLDPHFQPTLQGYSSSATQWHEQEESLLNVDCMTLYSHLDADDDDIGLPVWRARDRVIVGMQARASATSNEATRITYNVVDSLQRGCALMDCTFSYIIRSDISAHPVFDTLSPAPFSTVAPGSVHFAATAESQQPVVAMTLSVNGQNLTSDSGTLSGDISLPTGTYTVQSRATNRTGNSFTTTWDITVSSNPGDSEWFYANGQPNATQINATMRSLVQAFRWHLYGQSWDGADHPDLPTHASQITLGSPLADWVTGSTFDESSTNATLQSLVQAFRWHFWGISWDGAAHCDIPTHAVCTNPQPAQSIDPWFDANGNPIQANVTATLRSLVEAFRWHFWGFSWDGADHSDSMPTHGL